jgi:hypothetical protein
MRRLLTVVVLTAVAVLVPSAVALACEGHYSSSSATASIGLFFSQPGPGMAVLAAVVGAGFVRLARR